MAESARNALRFHHPHAHLGSPFGTDRFGQLAEFFARAFGTPQFLTIQTMLVIVWIVFNAIKGDSFDPYPFILLNLAFSTQAAYAAPLILLAETRQAERERLWMAADAEHREDLAGTTLQLLQRNTNLTEQMATLLQRNTDLTEQVAELSRRINNLTQEIHGRVVVGGAST